MSSVFNLLYSRFKAVNETEVSIFKLIKISNVNFLNLELTLYKKNLKKLLCI